MSKKVTVNGTEFKCFNSELCKSIQDYYEISEMPLIVRCSDLTVYKPIKHEKPEDKSEFIKEIENIERDDYDLIRGRPLYKNEFSEKHFNGTVLRYKSHWFMDHIIFTNESIKQVIGIYYRLKNLKNFNLSKYNDIINRFWTTEGYPQPVLVAATGGKKNLKKKKQKKSKKKSKKK